jgi:hypothetical protein
MNQTYHRIAVSKDEKQIPIADLEGKPVLELSNYQISIVGMPVKFSYTVSDGVHYSRHGKIVYGPFEKDAHSTLEDIAAGRHALKYRRVA